MAETRTPRDLVSREKSAQCCIRTADITAWPDTWAGVCLPFGSEPMSWGKPRPVTYLPRCAEGWEPVKAVDHPELQLYGNSATGNVEIGGLMLCKCSTEKMRARDEYYNAQAPVHRWNQWTTTSCETTTLGCRCSLTESQRPVADKDLVLVQSNFRSPKWHLPQPLTALKP
jgi:hypothetical protein